MAVLESPAHLVITDTQKQQYRDEGYFVLENAIPPAHLEAMRDACQQEINKDAEMEALGVDNVTCDGDTIIVDRRAE